MHVGHDDARDDARDMTSMGTANCGALLLRVTQGSAGGREGGSEGDEGRKEGREGGREACVHLGLRHVRLIAFQVEGFGLGLEALGLWHRASGFRRRAPDLGLRA